jgi:hypothetical protein
VKLKENFDASTQPLRGYDLVFLGTGIRGGEPYVELLSYLKTADLYAKKFELFMTWAGGGASNKLAYEGVKAALAARGQRLDADYFLCLGQTFGFTRRGHPNAGDLAEAKNGQYSNLARTHKKPPHDVLSLKADLSTAALLVAVFLWKSAI